MDIHEADYTGSHQYHQMQDGRILLDEVVSPQKALDANNLTMCDVGDKIQNAHKCEKVGVA